MIKTHALETIIKAIMSFYQMSENDYSSAQEEAVFLIAALSKAGYKLVKK